MKNVIVLLVDALRFDCIRGYPGKGRGYTRGVMPYSTPTMSGIVEKGRVFADAWTTHPYTSGACGSLATGMFPYKLNAAFNYVDSVLDPKIPTLGERLQERGVVVKHHFDFKPFSDLYGLDRGVDHVTYWDTEQDAPLVNWAANQEKPFYLLWHLGDVHQPYLQCWDDPDHNAYYLGYMSALCDEIGIQGERTTSRFWNVTTNLIYPYLRKNFPDRFTRLYVEGIQRFDQQRLARIWKWMEQKGVLEDTLVILMADHGEEFVPNRATYGYSMSEDLLHIPLALYHSSVKAHVVNRFVRIVDVPYTVASLMDADTRGMDGINLLEEIPENLPGYAERLQHFMCEYDPKKKFVIEEQAYREGDRKVVRGSTKAYGSYTIRGLAERKLKKEWSDLASKVQEFNQGRVMTPRLRDAPQEEIDDIMQRMEDLGYV